MRIRFLWAAALLLGLAVPGAASAATGGFTTGNVNMRAGPGTGYPVITTVPYGSSVAIYGCTAGYEWCDTNWAGYRGWVSGGYLEFVYQNRRVLVPNYGITYGIPIITFSIGDYWGRYYQAYPWWNDWHRWAPPPRGPIVGPGPGPLGDRALDVVLGHRGVLRLLDRKRQGGVAVGVAAALLGRDRDRPGELREELAAAGVDDRLLVLDPCPLGMTGHDRRC